MTRAAVVARVGLMCLSVTCLAGPGAARTPASAACVVTTHLNGIVNAGTADQLTDALAAAERQRCRALLITVDTPGGMLEQTRAIVRTFLGARLPILAHVAPGGARAGSAGAFIVMAAHVAAMAPASVIGAAHPVTGTGQDPEAAGGKHLGEKIENDTAALARSIAEQRGRNVEWAERAVRESASATAREALELGVIDQIARDVPALLAALEGQEVMVDGKPRVLRLSSARLVPHEPTIQQRVLTALGNPNLAYMLLMLGMLGVIVELHNPGLFVPGGLGVLCLLVSAVGLNLLPVNVGGLVLLVIAAALLVAEMYITSFGLLSLGAVGCLLLGSALLIDTADPRFFAEPDVRVSWTAVLPLAALLAGGSFALARVAARAARRHATVGAEGLVGERGRVIAQVSPRAGTVFIHGERWQATADAPIPPDRQVEVTRVEGLRLHVTPIQTTAAAKAEAAAEKAEN